jgi:hypothetical protein
LKIDLPIAEFLETHFADQRYSELRRTITGMVEGYDAADLRPSRSIVPKTAAAGSAAGPCDRAGAIPRSAADGNSTNSALTQGSAPRCLVECPWLGVPGLPRPFAGFVRDQIASYARISQITIGQHRQFLPPSVTLAPEAQHLHDRDVGARPSVMDPAFRRNVMPRQRKNVGHLAPQC